MQLPSSRSVAVAVIFYPDSLLHVNSVACVNRLKLCKQ